MRSEVGFVALVMKVKMKIRGKRQAVSRSRFMNKQIFILQAQTPVDAIDFSWCPDFDLVHSFP
jgi:hypothetical protein